MLIPCTSWSTFTRRNYVNFTTSKIGSLFKFFSSPLLNFVSNNNTEQPDELDMLLEIVSESDIHLLNGIVRETELQPSHQPYQHVATNSCVINASHIWYHSMCFGNTNHTSSSGNFATATENFKSHKLLMQAKRMLLTIIP